MSEWVKCKRCGHGVHPGFGSTHEDDDTDCRYAAMRIKLEKVRDELKRDPPYVNGALRVLEAILEGRET